MGGFKDMWKEVDAMTRKSKRDFEGTKAEIEALPGWKFQGCDGVVWRAECRKEGAKISNRSPSELVREAKERTEQWAERDRRQADDDAKRKAKGPRP